MSAILIDSVAGSSNGLLRRPEQDHLWRGRLGWSLTLSWIDEIIQIFVDWCYKKGWPFKTLAIVPCLNICQILLQNKIIRKFLIKLSSSSTIVTAGDCLLSLASLPHDRLLLPHSSRQVRIKCFSHFWDFYFGWYFVVCLSSLTNVLDQLIFVVDVHHLL